MVATKSNHRGDVATRHGYDSDDDELLFAPLPLQHETLQAQNAHLKDLLRQAGLDAQAHEAAQQIQRVLIDELHHRMKNMMAMVTAIVRQTMRSPISISDVERAVSTRLVAMAKAHELLLRADWENTSLNEVVRDATEQHNTAAGRIIIQGADIRIAAAVILPLTLAINELCTNAIKYGALSQENGRVHLSWNTDVDSASLILRWTESGGPPVVPPVSKSLGMRLIEHALPSQLGGSATMAFPTSGIEFQLAVPLVRIAPKAAPPQSEHRQVWSRADLPVAVEKSKLKTRAKPARTSA